ncbi:MAG: hypothetical protein B6D63_06055 [Candidatus Latescibacteria bacterium 4484_7]|nr:MAG: hypothetical protein B6D63_06055 [Candidatus Latescibacteria bacterium 4484_7]
MVFIKGGWFKMGSNDGEDDEKPVHRVWVDDFYMDKYEVTNAEYEVTNAEFKRFVDATAYVTTAEKEGSAWNWNGKEWKEIKGSNWMHPSGPGSGIKGKMDYPVVNVSWSDAVAYAEWAGKRLPTESEWEYAARGGLKGKKYPWGNEIMHNDANYWGTGGRDSWEYTAPVGSFPPNGYGLYDMAGNVWEWCLDWYDKKYYSKSPERNPKGPDTGTYRVVRGGGWYGGPRDLRCADRNFDSPEGRYSPLGFRCAKDAR